MYINLHPLRYLNLHYFVGKNVYFFLLGSLDIVYLDLKINIYNHYY